LPYLYESPEFLLFVRPTHGDYEKSLATLTKQSTDDLMFRFRTCIPINEGAEDLKIKGYNETINEFVKEVREYLDNLKKFKK
jgi:hypothetical protein